MNASGEGTWIGIIAGTNDDSGMSTLGFLVEADEIEPVQGDDRRC
jgi:hypothetical protein